ncbi:MAG: Rne/Rng family ribonuclease [Hyphomicrobiaceae bacterium]
MSGSNQNRNTSATNKMLIDATHPEETRVVVLRHGRVEEFDYESAARKLLRGNIYLAKVTRVEPSLQAAFVDYGGNRHGFLAFNEIHPDYYQIPIADRRALIEAEAAAEAEEEEAAERAAEAASRRRRRHKERDQGKEFEREAAADTEHADAEDDALDVTDLLPPEPGPDDTADEAEAEEHEAREGEGESSETGIEPETKAELAAADPTIHQDVPAAEQASASADTDDGRSEPTSEQADDSKAPEAAAELLVAVEDAPRAVGLVEEEGVIEVDSESDGEAETESENGNGAEPEHVETVSDEDALDELQTRPRRRLRSYKIQEVIKRRQVILIQVVKEERGTKGAALTTYLSLAGRYTVLMPNTARGGGISRKITNAQDRKRLKEIAAELDVPEGMGLIIRTAGASRTKQEIKRDYDYLLRLWESVRELAINSNAPLLVYEEGNLIKRSIRDLYGKEVDEIVVAGDAAYREAKDFMRMLMPSHAKNVIAYSDPEPLFSRFQIERQLNAMFSPYVHLRSGGYLVINQTEALVSIDINSGKSTREFSIEETALSTNLEAADEIARQLKLRDLAGLIVIDFIDMEEKRNNRAVERRLKDALRFDRARIQVGRISHFGLLEMSRQRLRTGVLEGSTSQCPHCQGTGVIRSTESVALAVLRGLEDALMTGQPSSLVASTTASVALYILNNKRNFIIEMENRYGITIRIVASEKMQGANFGIERLARRDDQAPRRVDRGAVNMETGFEDDDLAEGDNGAADLAGEQGDGRRRRRRRRRGRRDDRDTHVHGSRGQAEHSGSEPADDDDDDDGQPDVNGHDHYGEDAPQYAADADIDEDDGAGSGDDADAQRARTEDHDGDERRGRKGRRRGRRGGRRGHERERTDAQEAGGEDDGQQDSPSDDRDGDADEAGGAEPHQPHANGNGMGASGGDYDDAGHAHTAASGTEPETTSSVPPGSAHEQDEARHTGANGGASAEASIRNGKDKSEATEPSTAAEPDLDQKARTEPVASQPVLERIVVGDVQTATEAVVEEARSARRGWWQRR